MRTAGSIAARLTVLPAALAAVLNGEALAQTASPAASPVIGVGRMLADLRALAADSMRGRRTGTPGGIMARRYVERSFTEIGLEAPAGGYIQPFELDDRRETARSTGANVTGILRGSDSPDRVIVVTAHYDHLGERDGLVYNGADDNASGTAALLALARAFRTLGPRHTIVFAALDAEEIGLRGARAFVARPPVDRSAIAINVNLDMLGRNQAGELWVAGTRHSPSLLPLVERLAAVASVKLRVGHDRPGVPGVDDWTGSSDHAAFHAAGVPFLYFGVEDHADYHRATDDVERIDADFYARAVQTVATAVAALDRELDALLSRRAQ
jgi:Zn-dependent M28 family amino/carboxypeptidase